MTTVAEYLQNVKTPQTRKAIQDLLDNFVSSSDCTKFSIGDSTTSASMTTTPYMSIYSTSATGLYLEALATKTMYSGIYLHGAGTITNGIECAGGITYFLDMTNATEGASYMFDKVSTASGDIVGNIRVKDTDGSVAYINVYSDQGDAL